MVAMVTELRSGDAYDVDELRKENTLLWEANTHLQQRLAEQDKEVVYLRNQVNFHRDWRKQVDRVESEVLSSGQKATVAAIYGIIRSGEIIPNADGYYPIEPWRAAEMSGQATGTVRSHINYVSDVHEDGKPEKKAAVPLFDKRLVKIPDEKREGEFIEATYLKPLTHLPYPLDYRHIARQFHNIGGAGRGQGRKPRCEQCHGELQEKERIIDKQAYTFCPHCQITHTYPMERINEPETATVCALELPPMCVFCPTDDDGENQADYQGSEETGEPNQLDTVNTKEEHNQVDYQGSEEDQVQEDPSIPPLPLDASQIEAAACDLLLEIAGTGPEHIEMNKSPELGKYTTIHHRPHKGDMLAHLRGVRTKGASLHHPFGLARAFLFDGDTPERWQRLKEAAVLLKQAGFNPILAPSPAHAGEKHVGGGHLVPAIFDKLVVAHDAYQTIIDIAPMLAEINEYWPHEQGVNCPPNVRLPGGKYIRPGYEAWCHITDAYGNELSHDGAGAARVLLEMQTPAALVRRHEKKTELVLTQEAIAKPAPPTGGILGEKADVLNDVLREFEYSWDDLAALAGGYNKAGYFPAKWRGDKNPNVKEWKGHDLAKDFSTEAWPDCRCMDRHQVWCLLQAGENWREFRRLDLDARCKAYRASIAERQVLA